MADFDGTTVLQTKEWISEEMFAEFFIEDAEIIVLELSSAIEVVEKNKRLKKE